jgi:hypothetical protein
MAKPMLANGSRAKARRRGARQAGMQMKRGMKWPFDQKDVKLS